MSIDFGHLKSTQGRLIFLILFPFVAFLADAPGGPVREHAIHQQTVDPVYLNDLFSGKGPLDLVFVGASEVRWQVDTPLLQTLLSERTGGPSVVESIAVNGRADDLTFELLSRLSDQRRIRHLVVSLPQIGHAKTIPHAQSYLFQKLELGTFLDLSVGASYLSERFAHFLIGSYYSVTGRYFRGPRRVETLHGYYPNPSPATVDNFELEQEKIPAIRRVSVEEIVSGEEGPLPESILHFIRSYYTFCRERGIQCSSLAPPDLLVDSASGPRLHKDIKKILAGHPEFPIYFISLDDLTGELPGASKTHSPFVSAGHLNAVGAKVYAVSILKGLFP